MAAENRLSVLIVDDEYEICDVLSMQLERFGYNPIAVSSARGALERLQHEKIDLIIADNMMPGMSGIALVRELRKLNIPHPVIILSGCLPANIEQLKRDLKIDYVVSKPVGLRHLETVVTEALQIATAR
jgi:CheY-like chemotaxis protein